MLDLEGRVALVTGAGRGIGRAISLTLASYGVRIVAADINGDLLPSQKEELQDKDSMVLTFVVDVSQQPQVEATVKSCIDPMGRLDILVNNDGINFLTPQWQAIPENE